MKRGPVLDPFEGEKIRLGCAQSESIPDAIFSSFFRPFQRFRRLLSLIRPKSLSFFLSLSCVSSSFCPFSVEIQESSMTLQNFVHPSRVCTNQVGPFERERESEERKKFFYIARKKITEKNELAKPFLQATFFSLQFATLNELFFMDYIFPKLLLIVTNPKKMHYHNFPTTLVQFFCL
jgi:hypothetical protein